MTAAEEAVGWAACRGVPGGWRDPWDDPDDHAELRARAEAAERRHLAQAERLGAVWQGEILAERRERGRKRRSPP